MELVAGLAFLIPIIMIILVVALVLAPLTLYSILGQLKRTHELLEHATREMQAIGVALTSSRQ